VAGCGGGDADSGDAGPTATTTATSIPGADRATQLLLAVCAQTIRTVPDVPGPEATAADGRAYLRAVETAMSTLAPDLDRLATQDPSRRRVLIDLARRMRAVATVARRTTDGRAAPGTENDLASTIAVLNVAATRERLPQCGL
jgi:hypothetical protein